MSILAKNTVVANENLVGIAIYYSVLKDIKTANGMIKKEVLNIKDLLDYLSNFDISKIKKDQTKDILRKIRIRPVEIVKEDLIWESFIVANDDTYWRPYQIISDTSIEIQIECCNTLSADNTTCYATYDPNMIKKTFTIRRATGPQDIKLLLKLPQYSILEGTNETLDCNDITKTCTIKEVYHGTSYIMDDLAENAPYNYFGNWFTLGRDAYGNKGGESLAYMADQSNQNIMRSLLYEYKIKTPTKILYFNENNQIDYIFAHMMFFDCSVGSIDMTNRFKPVLLNADKTVKIPITDTDTDVNCFIFKDTNTIRQATDGMILKYNYTVKKNLLDITKEEPEFTIGYWSVIKSELTDDGDKGLAGKLCKYYNSKDNSVPLRLQISGWVVNNIFYLMACNPKEILENVGVYIKIFPNGVTGNPVVQEKLLKYFKLYLDKLIINPIRNEQINFEDYIFVPKDNYNIFRDKIKSMKQEYESFLKTKVSYNRRFKFLDFLFGRKYNDTFKIKNTLYDAYVNELSLKLNEPGDEIRLENHKKLTDPNIFLIGGSYYKKYLKYKSKYINLKNTFNLKN
jgi:hypothetical protein